MLKGFAVKKLVCRCADIPAFGDEPFSAIKNPLD
jgi:hypothetical protein